MLVFISHSSRDTWVAKQIARAIRERGAETFLDVEQVEIGADFEEEILDALNRADEFVVLLTPWALDRHFVWIEIGAAWQRHLRIIGLLHGVSPSDIDARPGTPVLKRRNLLDINAIDTYLQQLEARVDAADLTT